MDEPLPTPPDDKDWAAVSADGCPQCGFQPVGPDRIPGRIRETIPGWWDALHSPGATVRPAPTVWSTLEYGCHVRDVCEAFTDRLDRVLAAEGAVCPSFDGNAAAVERRYVEQVPGEVAEQLATRAETIAQRFISVRPEQWGRRGVRSDGLAFTIASLSNYFLHELEHHLHDVAGSRR